MLTRGEMDGLTAVTAITVLAHILASAWAAWLQERDTRRLRAEVNELRAWCIAAAEALGWTDDDGQGPDDGDEPPPDDDPDDGPSTVIAHPLDMWERQEALLARYTHIGTHRG